MPAWFASILQVPTAVNETTLPAMEQPVLVPSIVNVTGSPEVAVAVTVYVAPPTLAAGGTEVKLIVWLPCPTVKDCCACVAGFQFASPA